VVERDASVHHCAEVLECLGYLAVDPLTHFLAVVPVGVGFEHPRPRHALRSRLSPRFREVENEKRGLLSLPAKHINDCLLLLPSGHVNSPFLNIDLTSLGTDRVIGVHPARQFLRVPYRGTHREHLDALVHRGSDRFLNFRTAETPVYFVEVVQNDEVEVPCSARIVENRPVEGIERGDDDVGTMISTVPVSDVVVVAAPRRDRLRLCPNELTGRNEVSDSPTFLKRFLRHGLGTERFPFPVSATSRWFPGSKISSRNASRWVSLSESNP